MSDLKIEITASIVAWYAAIVSTAAAGLSAFQIYWDRAIVKIKVLPNRGMVSDTSDTDGKTFVMIEVANSGRRPVTISHVSFEQKTGAPSHLLLWGEMNRGPRELTEGKSTSYFTDQTGIDWVNIKRVVVSDATGKQYYKKVDPRVFSIPKKAIREST